MPNRAYLQQLSIKLIRRGLFVEAGWVRYQLEFLDKNMPDEQLDEMRRCFFCGASHLYSNIVMINLDESAESDEQLTLIDQELTSFSQELELRVADTKGTA